MPAATELPAAAVRRLLTAVLRSPEGVVTSGVREVDLTLRLARRARLLGRLAERLQRGGLIADRKSVV